MSIRRSYYDGPITFACDECGDEHDTDEDNFGLALADMKEAGWWLKKDEGGSWSHLCKECSWVYRG